VWAEMGKPSARALEVIFDRDGFKFFYFDKLC